MYVLGIDTGTQGTKTLVFDPGSQSSRNSLYSLASVGGVLLGFFLLAAAYGHFAAVWPAIDSEAAASDYSRFALLLPGLILATTGLIDIGEGMLTLEGDQRELIAGFISSRWMCF